MNDSCSTPYIQTVSGRRVNPLAVRVADVDINEVAHSLACVNRFSGHATQPISVAQHSWYVSQLCDGLPCALQGLLHDGAEAFLGDVTKWLKRTDIMAGYRVAEADVQRVVFQAFGCAVDVAPEVEAADRLMVRYEAEHAFRGQWQCDHPDYPRVSLQERRLVESIRPWVFLDWRRAKYLFLERYAELVGAPLGQVLVRGLLVTR